ncbi:MAG TPA: hypothetical protein VH641_16800 [Streptosporangiaceae bacterium]
MTIAANPLGAHAADQARRKSQNSRRQSPARSDGRRSGGFQSGTQGWQRGRGGHEPDKTGAIRDVVQNHMLQVLATVLADPPGGQGLASWRDARSHVVSALRPLTAGHAMTGA